MTVYSNYKYSAAGQKPATSQCSGVLSLRPLFLELSLHPIKPETTGLPEPKCSSVPSRALYRVISKNKYPAEGQSPALLQFQFHPGSGHFSTTMKWMRYHIQKEESTRTLTGKRMLTCKLSCRRNASYLNLGRINRKVESCCMLSSHRLNLECPTRVS